MGGHTCFEQVMIYLIDHVLPDGYFGNNLRSLSVDMAVFRDMLRSQLPRLASHLNSLQATAKDQGAGECRRATFIQILD